LRTASAAENAAFSTFSGEERRSASLADDQTTHHYAPPRPCSGRLRPQVRRFRANDLWLGLFGRRDKTGRWAQDENQGTVDLPSSTDWCACGESQRSKLDTATRIEQPSFCAAEIALQVTCCLDSWRPLLSGGWASSAHFRWGPRSRSAPQHGPVLRTDTRTSERPNDPDGGLRSVGQVTPSLRSARSLRV